MTENPNVPADSDQAVLRARARALAAPPDCGESAGDWMSMVRFRQGGADYAFELTEVHGAAAVPALTPAPAASGAVVAMCNLRGVVLAVLDLSAAVGGYERTGTERYLVILGRRGPEAAVLADEIHGVRRVLTKELQPAPGGSRSPIIRGILSDGTILLNAAPALHPETESASGPDPGPAIRRRSTNLS